MARDLSIDLGYAQRYSPAERRVRDSLAWAAPMVPAARRTTVPRWAATPTWTPPGTILLVRHRATDGSGRRIVTNDRVPPPGFEIEFDLGLVHAHAQPGTVRLLSGPDGLFTTPFEGGLDDDHVGVGHVELAPLPLLEALVLRRDPATRQTAPAAGEADPLTAAWEPVVTLGFVEGYPINPRVAPDVRASRNLSVLQRIADDAAWRHRYLVAPRREPGAVALGGVWRTPRPGFVPLLRWPDGTVSSPRIDARPARLPAPRDALRWAGAPVRWAGGRPQGWAARAAASRLRHLARAAPAGAARRRGGEPEVLGYLAGEALPGWSPLHLATHPALGDQYLTRSATEARDMGYRVEGVLGWVADRRADRAREQLPHEVKWASRFGHSRRYVEGPADAAG